MSAAGPTIRPARRYRDRALLCEHAAAMTLPMLPLLIVALAVADRAPLRAGEEGRAAAPAFVAGECLHNDGLADRMVLRGAPSVRPLLHPPTPIKIPAMDSPTCRL